MIHVAILLREYLDAILDDRKTIELRLTRTARDPFEAIEPGERIYFKQSAGPFRATAIAEHVLFLKDLTPARIARLRREYNHAIGGATAFWQSRRDALFATLIWLTKVEPVRFGPRMRPHHGVAWQVLPEGADVYPKCIEQGSGQESQAVLPVGLGIRSKGQGSGVARQTTKPASGGRGLQPSAPASGPLILPLTSGNIRNGHVYIRRLIDRFPADALGGTTKRDAARPISLHFDDGTVIETDIVQGRGIFRTRCWRGWFESQGATAGDSVILTPDGPRRYRVSLRRGVSES